MTFVDQFKKLNWDDISMSIYAKTAKDVERALAKPQTKSRRFQGATLTSSGTLLGANGAAIICVN